MTTTELGYLRIGDEFYFEGQRYKACSLGNKDVNNVCCSNLETKKRLWLDVTTEDRIIDIMLGFDLGVVIALVIISIVTLIVIKKGE